MTDLISRANAIDALCEECSERWKHYKECDLYKDGQCFEITALMALPSAEPSECESCKWYEPDHLICYPNDDSDLISRADAICEVLVNDGIDNIVDRINALPSAELPKGDLISRADVLKYPIRLDHYDEVNGNRHFVYGVESVIEYVESLPSADAKPTVIRAKTFMRKEDFDKWAEDIKRQNKSIVCIPCDAEVVSADAAQGEWEHWGSPFSDESEVIDTIVCSVCGARFIEPKDEPKGEYNYCPNCGARMKGGDDE